MVTLPSALALMSHDNSAPGSCHKVPFPVHRGDREGRGRTSHFMQYLVPRTLFLHTALDLAASLVPTFLNTEALLYSFISLPSSRTQEADPLA